MKPTKIAMSETIFSSEFQAPSSESKKLETRNTELGTGSRNSKLGTLSVLAVAVFALSFPAQAATRTWTGSISGAWTNASNWSPAVAPANGDVLVFPEGPSQLNTTNVAAGATNLDAISLTGSNYFLYSPSLNLTNGITNSAAFFTTNSLLAAVTCQATQTWSVGSKNWLLVHSNVNILNRQLTVDASAELQGFGNWSGVFGGRLVKTGAGILRLKGTSSIPLVEVNAGHLFVDGTLSVPAPENFTVAAGASIAGSGTVSGFNCSGSVRPGGDDVGSLTVNTTNLTFNPGSTFTVNLNGTNAGTTYDQLSVTHRPSLASATLQIVKGYSPNFGDTFVIITNTGPSLINTAFTGWADGSTQTVSNVKYRISYSGGNGNDVTLTVVGFTATGFTRTWDGGGANDFWNNNTNWTSEFGPSGGDNVTFPATAPRKNNTNNFVNYTLNRLRLDTNGYTLNGNTLTLLGGIFATNVAGVDIINHGLIFDGTQGVTNANTGALVLNGAVSISGTLAVVSPGAVQFNGPVSGAGNLISSCDGLVLNAANTYTGTTEIQSGWLYLGANTSLGSVSAGTTVRSGAGISISANLSIAEPLTLEGKIDNGDDSNFWTGPISLTGTNAVIQVAGGDLIVSGAISGTGGVSLDNNGGNLTFTGTNSYSGDTRLVDGLVVINGSQPSSRIMLAGGTVGGSGRVGEIVNELGGGVSPGASTGILTAGNVVLTSGSSLTVEINGMTPGTGYDQLQVQGTVTLGAAQNQAPNLILSSLAAPAVGSVLTIIDNDGADAVSGTFAGLPEGASLTNNGAAYSISYVGGTGNDVTLTRIYGPTGITRTWDGGAGGDRNWTNPTNWVGDVAPSAGDSLVFPDIAGVRIATNNFPAGTGFQSIRVAGGYDLFGNKLELHSGGLLCIATNVTLGTIYMPLALVENQVCVVTNANLNFVGSLDVGASVVTFSNGVGASCQISGNVTGSGMVVVSGVGNFYVNGPTSFDGVMDFAGGLVFLGTNTSLGSAVGGTIVESNATLGLPNCDCAMGDALTLRGKLVNSNARTLTWSGAVTLDTSNAVIQSGSSAGRTVLAGDVAGSGSYVYTGVGTVVVSGNDSHTGASISQCEFLEVNGNISSSAVTVGNGGFGSTLSGTGTVARISGVGFCTISPGGNSPGILHNTTSLSLFNDILKMQVFGGGAGTGHDQLEVGGTVSLTGLLYLSLTTSNSVPPGVPLTIIKYAGANSFPTLRNLSPNYTLSEGSFITNNGVVLRISYQGGDGNDVTLTRVILPTGVTRVWDGGGANNLWSSATNWVGDVAPSDGDALYFPPGAPRANSVNDLPIGIAFDNIVTGSNYVFSGSGTINLNSGITTTNGIVNFNTGMRFALLAPQTFRDSSPGGMNFIENWDLRSHTLTLEVNQYAEQFGDISGTGGLIKTGPQQLLLHGSNSYSGPTIISNGTINIYHDFALGSAAGSTEVRSNATLGFASAITCPEPLVVSGQLNFGPSDSTLTGPMTLPGPTATFSANGAAANFNGVISGPGGFKTFTSGIIRLNANNTYTGLTEARAGILVVNGSQPSSRVDLGSPSTPTLAGVGTIGTLTVGTNSGHSAMVAPGGFAQFGRLTVNGSFITGHSGPDVNSLIFDLEQTTNDALRVTGDVVLGPNTSLNLNYGPIITNSAFTIIENLGTNPVSGTFQFMPEGTMMALATNTYRISYAGGDGNDVTLTLVALAGPSTITNTAVVTNAFHITGLGEPNLSYALEASTNLVNWSQIMTANTDGAGVYRFVDPQFGLFPRRFYRVKSP